MSNDGRSEDLSSLAGRVASARRSAAERRQTNGPKYPKYVRVFFFLYVVVFAILLGWRFRSYSSSGDINFVQPVESAYFDVYVSNPYISVKLNLSVSVINNDAELDLTMNAPQTVHSGTIVLISTIPAKSSSEAKQIPLNRRGSHPQTIYESQTSFNIPGKLSGKLLQFPVAYLDVDYKVSDVVLTTKDRIFVRLPSLEESSLPNSIGPLGPEYSVPELMSEKDPKTDQLIGFTNNIYPISYLKVNNLSDYRTAYGVPDALFWSPEITSTVEVAGLGQVVHDDQIDSVVPAGTVQQDGYSWQSNGSLAPYLTATDPSAVAEESTWDFRSGIAFGIAVGAGVALVQELPDAIQPSRRWRKRRLKRS